MRDFIYRCPLSLGDIVLLTAAVRDLQLHFPDSYRIDVRTCFPGLWKHNPYLTPLGEYDPGVKVVDCVLPLINESHTAACHSIHGFLDFFNQYLGASMKPTAFQGDIHLSRWEKTRSSQVQDLSGTDLPFWLISAGGKYDCTIKWWEASRYQEVVDHFRGRVQFVQVGDAAHYHPKLRGAIDLRGRTSLRELILLVHHAEGVLCGVTGLMHLAAAVPVRRGRHPVRPCVVIAGGRESPHWEAYPGHQFIRLARCLAAPAAAAGGLELCHWAMMTSAMAGNIFVSMCATVCHAAWTSLRVPKSFAVSRVTLTAEPLGICLASRLARQAKLWPPPASTSSPLAH